MYHCSQHVRVFGKHLIGRSCSGMVDSQTLRTISTLKPSVLFPKLRSIVRCPCMESMGHECIPALLSLCGPYLRNVDLGRLQYLPEFLTSTLSSIFGRFFHLESCSISFFLEGTPTLTEERSARKLMLPPFAAHQLTRFSCLNIPLEDESFNLISRLPRLRYLCCEVSSTADLSSFSRGPIPFPALKELDVKMVVWRYIDFSKVYLPGVHDARFTFIQFVDSSQLLLALSHIHKQFSASALRRLTLLAYCGGGPGRVVLLPSHLRPLFDFRELTWLHLQMPACDLRLDDQVCADMADAWRHMQYLAIYTTREVLNPPTLQGLTPFAIHCTKLVSLGLCVNARDFDEGTIAKLSRRLERSPLTSLHVGDSPISRPDRVAAFLSRMFPHLRSISHSKSRERTPEAETRDRDWNEVQRYISLFAEIREDERRRVELERDKEDKPSGLVRGDSQ